MATLPESLIDTDLKKSTPKLGPIPKLAENLGEMTRVPATGSRS